MLIRRGISEVKEEGGKNCEQIYGQLVFNFGDIYIYICIHIHTHSGVK